METNTMREQELKAIAHSVRVQYSTGAGGQFLKTHFAITQEELDGILSGNYGR